MIENNNGVLNESTLETVNNTSGNITSAQPEIDVNNSADKPSSAMDTEEEKLKREAQVGEHDIVIEEDFQISLDVASVEDSFSPLSADPNTPEIDNTPIELGSEQSGNITF